MPSGPTLHCLYCSTGAQPWALSTTGVQNKSARSSRYDSMAVSLATPTTFGACSYNFGAKERRRELGSSQYTSIHINTMHDTRHRPCSPTRPDKAAVTPGEGQSKASHSSHERRPDMVSKTVHSVARATRKEYKRGDAKGLRCLSLCAPCLSASALPLSLSSSLSLSPCLCLCPRLSPFHTPPSNAEPPPLALGLLTIASESIFGSGNGTVASPPLLPRPYSFPNRPCTSQICSQISRHPTFSCRHAAQQSNVREL